MRASFIETTASLSPKTKSPGDTVRPPILISTSTAATRPRPLMSTGLYPLAKIGRSMVVVKYVSRVRPSMTTAETIANALVRCFHRLEANRARTAEHAMGRTIEREARDDPPALAELIELV